MDSELQIALVGLGVAAVVGIVAYNKWQERKHSRHAEKTFRRDTHDVLLDPAPAAKESKNRREPKLDGEGDDGFTDVTTAAAAAAPASAPNKAGGRHKTPGIPGLLDTRIDCAIVIESIEVLEASRLWPVQHAQLQDIEKPVRWFGFDDRENVWRMLDGHSASAHHWFCASMQMVDRRGAINADQFQHFSDAVQHVADQFLAVPANVPVRATALASASEVDNFCASVDIQVGINIVTDGEAFPGTKVRALAEAGGLSLGDDGAFHAIDDDGRTLFTLSNLEPSLFAATEMRNLSTHGLTFLLDVPLVTDGVGTFDRMMRQAKQMADTLHGVVVDDNRSPIGPEAAQLIRDQIRQFQAEMANRKVPAGGPLSIRLFSA